MINGKSSPEQSADLLGFEHVRAHLGQPWLATRLVKRGNTLPLPGKPDAIDATTAGKAGCALLLAERHSGMAVLMKQWLAWAKAYDWPALMVHGTRPLSTFEPAQSLAFGVGMDRVLHAMQDAPAILADVLLKLLGEADAFVLLVSFDDASHSEEKTRVIVSQLRAAFEGANGRLRIVVAAPSYNILLDTGTTSGLITVGDVYRLASFDVPAIVSMLRSRLSDQDPTDSWDDAARRIWRATGGQPFLVNVFLERCVEARAANPGAGVAALVRRVVPMVERTPPAIVRIWQDQLHLVLSRTPELARVMEQYVENNPRRIDPPWPEPPAIETELFACGWIGERVTDGHREWGIRSDLHREWARPVLWRMR